MNKHIFASLAAAGAVVLAACSTADSTEADPGTDVAITTTAGVAGAATSSQVSAAAPIGQVLAAAGAICSGGGEQDCAGCSTATSSPQPCDRSNS